MKNQTNGARHTPGPWTVCLGKVVPDAETFGFAILAEGKVPSICRAGTYEAHMLMLDKSSREIHPDSAAYFAPEEVEANARLIATAPELLEACRWALKAWTEKPPIGKTLAELQTMLRAAIARAEGGEPGSD